MGNGSTSQALIKCFFADLPKLLQLYKGRLSVQLDCPLIPGPDEDALTVSVVGLYHLAKTRAAVELTSISNMPNARVPLATGTQCVPTSLQPLPEQKLSKLIDAVNVLLRRFLTDPEVAMDICADEWFRSSILPHVERADGHARAVTAALAMCLATGRLDLVVAGLFGAGKTRAAAILILSLVAIGPTIHIAVVSKENIAARSIAPTYGVPMPAR